MPIKNLNEVNKETTLDEVIAFLKSEDNQHTFEELDSFLENIPTTYDVYFYTPKIVIAFLNNEHNPNNRISLENLEKILTNHSHNASKNQYEIISLFLQNPNNQISLTQLETIIEKTNIKRPSDKALLIVDFLKNQKNDITLTELLVTTNKLSIVDEDAKETMIDYFFEKNGEVSIAKIKEVLKNPIEDQYFKYYVIAHFLSIPNATKNEVSLQDLKDFLYPNIKNPNYKKNIIIYFLGNQNNPNNQISAQDLIDLVNEIRNNGIKEFIDFDEIKLDIVKSFLRNPKNIVSKEDLSLLIKELNITHQPSKIELINFFLRNSNTQISTDQLTDIIFDNLILKEFDKYSLISSFLGNQNNPKNRISIRELRNLITGHRIKDESHIFGLARSFLENQNNPNNQISVQGLKDLISDYEINDDLNKRLLIESFLENPNNQISIRELNSLISGDFGIKDQHLRTIVIQSFLNNPNNPNNKISSEELKALIDDNKINNEEDTSRLVTTFLEKRAKDLTENKENQDVDKFFVDLINNSNLSLRVDLTAKLLTRYKSIADGVNLRNVIRELYPLGIIKSEFLKEYYNRSNKIRTNSDVEELRVILQDFTEDDLVLEVIDYLKEEKLITQEHNDPQLILGLVKGRFSSKYSSIEHCFKDDQNKLLPLSECLTEEGLGVLKGIFGEELLIDGVPIEITYLLSYYDIQKELGGFSDLLKPKLKEEIRKKFRASKKDCLIKVEEVNKFSQLFGNKGVNEIFIHITSLIDYFSKNEKLKTVKEFLPTNSKEEGWKCNIGFGEVTYDNPEDWSKETLLRILKIFNPELDQKAQDEIGELFIIHEETKKLFNQLGDLRRDLKNLEERHKYDKNKESNEEILAKKREISEKNAKIASNNEKIFANKGEIKKVFIKLINTTSSVNLEYDEDLDKVIKERIEKLFNEIIRKDNRAINQEDVINFFQIAFPAVSFDEMDSESKSKLRQFFINNKSELAYFFSEIGLDKLGSALFSTVKHGCANNIGNQFSTVINSFIFAENKYEAALYYFLDKKIRSILNSGKDDNILSYNNPFENPKVRNYYVSPDGLLEEMSKGIESQLSAEVGEINSSEINEKNHPTLSLLIPDIMEIENLLKILDFAINEITTNLDPYEILSKAITHKILENTLSKEEFEKISYSGDELKELIIESENAAEEYYNSRPKKISELQANLNSEKSNGKKAKLLSDFKNKQALFDQDQVFIKEENGVFLVELFPKEKADIYKSGGENGEYKSLDSLVKEWEEPSPNPSETSIKKVEEKEAEILIDL